MEANGTLCHELAICVNTPGNYTCECVAGYEGDGVYSCRGMWQYFFINIFLPHVIMGVL